MGILLKFISSLALVVGTVVVVAPVGDGDSRANQTIWHYQRNWSISGRKLSALAGIPTTAAAAEGPDADAVK